MSKQTFTVVYYVRDSRTNNPNTEEKRAMGPFEDRRQAEACVVQLAARASVSNVSIREDSTLE